MTYLYDVNMDINDATKRHGQITVGPISSDVVLQGKCLVRLLREVGDLTEVVPVVELTFTANGEFVHTVFTVVEKVYYLDSSH